MDTTAIDLAFPIVDGRLVAIDHAHALYGALKQACPALGEVTIGVHPLRGTPLGEWLQLRHHEHLRVRLAAERIPLALPLAGREMRIGSHLLRLGAPRIEALAPHANLYARTVVLVKKDGQDRRGRPANEAEAVAAAQAAAGPTARVHILRRRTLRIHGVQVPGYELVLEGLDTATSLRLQAEGLGGRRSFGCGIFVSAGVRKPATAALATATSDEVGHA